MKRFVIIIAAALIASSCAIDAAIGGAAQGAAEVQAAKSAQRLIDTATAAIATTVPAATGDCATDTAALNHAMDTPFSDLTPVDRNASQTLYLSIVVACPEVPDRYATWSQ